MMRRILLVSSISFIFLFSCSATPFKANTLTRKNSNFQKGIAYTGYSKDSYEGPGPSLALRELNETNASWVSILVNGYQDNINSTVISRTGDETPTDASLRSIISFAHSIGLKVMLKPHVDLLYDNAHWRGQIGPNFTPEEWAAWFASYREFILHYARMAAELDVEQFSAGCELDSTVSHEAEWRQIIADIRIGYKGSLTYADNQVESNPSAVQFWDAVDIIGMDTYATLTQKSHPKVIDLLIGWKSYLAKLRSLSERWNRPLILTEIGYRSIRGGAQNPWDWQRQDSVDLILQANCYEAALRSVAGKPWLAGMYWWQWSPDPSEGGFEDSGYTPHGKPAETVLRNWYKKSF
jgi:hypothetical protein